MLQGIVKTLCVNKMVKSGCKVKILMTDWFAQMNHNIGGSLNKMQTIGLYNIEVWKAAGMALDSVELVWLSDEINRHADEFWLLAMDVSRRTTVRRIKRYILVWIILVFNVYFHLETFKFEHQMEEHLNMQVISFLFTCRCYGSRDPFDLFTAADVFYPSLQCATILFQKVVFTWQ